MKIVMELYVNARFLLQRLTGVERYAYGICRAMVRAGIEVVLICPKNGKINDSYDVSEFRIVRYGIGGSHFWEQLVLPFFFIGKKNYLLVSFTGLGSILIPNKIMTIHDLSFLENPSWFSWSYYHYYKLMTPLAAETSKMILTVSEFSKREILRYYSVLSPEKVIVIYNAVDREKFPKVELRRKSKDLPYILAVSSLEPRKNLNRLIRVFQEINSCRLKVVGGGNRVFNANCDMENGDNVEYLGYVSDEELQSLYTDAAAFIYPSLYEGFGIPPIEAMAFRCPILVSDIPVLREVCGDAAEYFDPLDNHSISVAIQQTLIMSQTDKEKMIERGLRNIRRFSWEQSAKKIIDTVNGL